MVSVELVGNKQTVKGILYFFEGELMVVSIEDAFTFKSGDIVSLGKKEGLKATIIKVRGQEIYLFISIKEKNPAKRKIPRIKVNISAMMNDYLSDRVYEFPPDIRVQINEISFRGFNILSDAYLSLDIPYYLYINEGFLSTKIKIKLLHEEKVQNNFEYKTQILAITQDDFQKLRRYILLQQLNSFPQK